MTDINSRLRKEFKIIPESKNFKIAYGTINRLNPIVIYVKVNTWAKYKGDIKYYNDNIDKLNSIVKNTFKRELNNSKTFDTKYFYTPDIKKVLTNSENYFHICFEFTIKQKNVIINDIKQLSDEIKNISNHMISSIENNSNFEFKEKK